MSNGTTNRPTLTTHPTAPAAGRVIQYIYDDGGGLTEPYFMLSDGIPRTLSGVTDHALLSNIGINTHTQIDSHIADNANPHAVTKTQLGLGNVDNTSDLSKPISTLTQAALDLKQDILTYFRWVLQAGHSNLPSNGTETGFSYGNNTANDGITAMNDGEIEGMSVRLEPARTAGSASYIITLNNVNNNVAGQRVVIDGTIGVEGELSSNSGTVMFSPPLPYVKGDQIEIRAITVGWTPTSSDSSVTIRLKENLL